MGGACSNPDEHRLESLHHPEGTLFGDKDLKKKDENIFDSMESFSKNRKISGQKMPESIQTDRLKNQETIKHKEQKNIYFKLTPKKYQKLGKSHFEFMDIGQEPRGIRRYNMDDISVKLGKSRTNPSVDDSVKLPSVKDESQNTQNGGYELDLQAEPLQYGNELRNVKISFKKYENNMGSIINDIEMVDQHSGYVNFLGKGLGRFTLQNGKFEIKMLVECKFYSLTLI
jgi:hypothetical protein